MKREGIARTRKGETVVLSCGLSKVLAYVAVHGSASYGGLMKGTQLERNTLHVYAQRLENAGLIKRITKFVNGRQNTTVILCDGVQVIGNLRRLQP